MDIVSLAIRVSTQEINRAQSGLRDLNGTLNSTQSTAFKFGSAIGGAMKFAAGAAIAAAGAVGTLTLAYAAQIDDLNDLAQMYGYSITQISAMKTAAEAAGGSFDDITKASAKARKELASGGEAFTNLGVSMRDSSGKMKAASVLAEEVARKYESGATSAAQYSDVQKILGKDVDKTAAVLVAAADSNQLVNELHKQGIGIIEESVTATDDFAAAKAKASLVMQSAGSILVANVLPAFTSLIEALTESYTSGGFVKQMFDALIASAPVIISFGGFVAKVFVTAANTLKVFGTMIGAAAAALVELANGNWRGAISIGKMFIEDGNALDAQTNASLASIDKFVATTNDKLGKIGNGTLAKSTTGKDPIVREPGTPKATRAKARPPQESAIIASLGTEEKALIKLQNEYSALFGVREQTHVQMVQAEIDSGKYAEKKNEEGQVIRKGATEHEIARLLQTAADADYLKGVVDIATAEKDAQANSRDMVQSEIDRIAQNNISREVMAQFGATQEDVNLALTDYAIKSTEAQLATAYATDATSKETIALREKLKALNEIRGLQASDADAASARQDEQRTFASGWQNAFKKYQEEANDAAGTAQQVFDSATQNMENALQSFVLTGKLSFKDLTRSILADLAQIMAKKAIAGLIGSMFGGGFADGGAFSGGAQFFAKGGVVNRATPFGMSGGKVGVMGEAGPEAIMPLQRGPDGKLGVRMNGGAGASSQNIQTNHITVQGGASGNKEDDVALAKTISAVIDKKWSENMAKANRPGGMNNRVTLQL